MRSFLKERRIDTLFHFTRADNLPNILRYGLLPKEDLLDEDIDACFNDHYRYDGCENAICASIEFPNYKMFYSLRMENSSVDWIVLQLDADILLDYECAFCVTNAGSEEAYSVALEERMGIDALKRLYDEYPGKPSRQELGIKSWYPTNPQAEVLVFGRIPVECIKEVCFCDWDALEKYRVHIPEGIKVNVNREWFFPRSDWRFW